METGVALKIEYWIGGTGGLLADDFEGVEEFHEDLKPHYVSTIHRRPGPRGGLYELVIEVLSNVSLTDVVTWLSSGIAFDLLKSGSKAFVLRPFLAAYRKFTERNKTVRVRVGEVRLLFQDSVVHIFNIFDNDSIFPHLERILTALAQHYRSMILASGEAPFTIYIPIFEDPAPDRLVRFRVLLGVDETIEHRTAADYTRYWGLHYDYAEASKVFDVARDLIINQEFWDLQRYWSEWRHRWDQEQTP